MSDCTHCCGACINAAQPEDVEAELYEDEGNDCTLFCLVFDEGVEPEDGKECDEFEPEGE